MSRWNGYGAEMGSSMESWEQVIDKRVVKFNSPSASFKTLDLFLVELPYVQISEGIKSDKSVYVIHKIEKRAKFKDGFKLDKFGWYADNICRFLGNNFFKDMDVISFSFPEKNNLSLSKEMWVSQTQIHLANILFDMPECKEVLTPTISLKSEGISNNEFVGHLRQMMFANYGEYLSANKLNELIFAEISKELSNENLPKQKLRDVLIKNYI
jgi:hypothetical protein